MESVSYALSSVFGTETSNHVGMISHNLLPNISEHVSLWLCTTCAVSVVHQVKHTRVSTLHGQVNIFADVLILRHRDNTSSVMSFDGMLPKI